MTIGQDRPAAPEVSYPSPHPMPTPWDVVEPLPVPRELTWSRWIWLVGSAVTVAAGGVYMAAAGANLITEVMLGATLLMAALAVPPALMLPSGARWARTMLVVMSALTLGSIYRCVLHGFWPALAINVPMAATYFLLRTDAAKAYFADRPARH